jgi:3-oxoacyl-ACP reductase-like protein
MVVQLNSPLSIHLNKNPMNSLTGKVAIVTGASKGIGASIAKAFCAEGASLS